jgi:hypothetical protein
MSSVAVSPAKNGPAFSGRPSPLHLVRPGCCLALEQFHAEANVSSMCCLGGEAVSRSQVASSHEPESKAVTSFTLTFQVSGVVSPENVPVPSGTRDVDVPQNN